MKKIRIFRTFENEVTKKIETQTLRQITVDKSFIGFGRMGKVISQEFDNLAKDLEPSSTGWLFLN